MQHLMEIMQHQMNNIFMSIKLLMIFLLITVSVEVTAKEVVDTPIRVQADSMKYFGKDKRSVFSGNVISFNETFNLTSDSVTVLLDDNLTIWKIISDGNVNFKTDDIISTADTAELNEKSKVIVLQGDVKVWQAENLLEGDKMTIYYEENKILIDKGTDSRVNILFKPEKKEE